MRVVRRNAPRLGAAEHEEVVQDVFLTAFDAAKRIRNIGSTKSWLCGIAVRSARSRQRKGWLRGNLMNQYGGETTGLAATHEASVESRLQAKSEVIQALKVLPEAQRQVLLLHVVENLSCDEIAETLGIRSKTVWTRLHRARQKMRAALEEQESENE